MPSSPQNSGQVVSAFDPSQVVSAAPRGRSWRPNWDRLGVTFVTLFLWIVLIWGAKAAFHALGH